MSLRRRLGVTVTSREERQLALDLGDGSSQVEEPSALGHASITYRDAGSILTRASGFMSAYDFTLNPYSGCSFGCTYCYAASFVADNAARSEWGRWVEVKRNALQKLDRMRTPLEGARIYMSSVTDPYQPIERKLGLVRSLLERLVERQPRLVVQTRSPLVTRDIDLLSRFHAVQVNMTVTTDIEDVRRHFEPWCPTSGRRLEAVKELNRAGIRTAVTMTPLLPVSDAAGFAHAVAAVGADHHVVQPFHPARAQFAAGTRQEAMDLLERYGWNDMSYRRAVAELHRVIPGLEEGREGFAPL
jgi:DNA repair photolyase